VKWKNWLTPGTGIGIHPHSTDPTWFKPTTNACKMEALNLPFCKVCNEAMIERIHALTNPIVRYSPTTTNINSGERFVTFKLNALLKPNPNTLKITWRLNGTVVTAQNQRDSFRLDQNTLPNGASELTVSVLDTTLLTRSSTHPTAHLSTVKWTIQKMTTGMEVIGEENKLNLSVYPNPVGEVLQFAITMERPAAVSVAIFSLDGKLLQQVNSPSAPVKYFKTSADVAQLAAGTYTVVFQIGGITHTQLFVKR
jgi:hypothetical protein